MAKLILTLNGSVINQYFIDKACVSIGRGADNDIVINDPVLSREHARVVSVGKDQIVEDLQSSNGTWSTVRRWCGKFCSIATSSSWVRTSCAT